MEDDLNILKVLYLSNHSSDPPQILNLGSKILEVEYLNNLSLDPPQILNLSSGDQTKI
jgi:hypothetical protein